MKHVHLIQPLWTAVGWSTIINFFTFARWMAVPVHLLMEVWWKYFYQIWRYQIKENLNLYKSYSQNSSFKSQFNELLNSRGIDYKIYRKPTCTDAIISKDFFHHPKAQNSSCEKLLSQSHNHSEGWRRKEMSTHWQSLELIPWLFLKHAYKVTEIW